MRLANRRPFENSTTVASLSVHPVTNHVLNPVTTESQALNLQAQHSECKLVRRAFELVDSGLIARLLSKVKQS